MPQLDKSGPRGQGSQTGKKRGNCNNQETNNAEFGSWRKAGRGRGKGKGLQGRMNRSAEVELEGANGAGWGRGQRCRMQQNRNSQL